MLTEAHERHAAAGKIDLVARLPVCFIQIVARLMDEQQAQDCFFASVYFSVSAGGELSVIKYELLAAGVSAKGLALWRHHCTLH